MSGTQNQALEHNGHQLGSYRLSRSCRFLLGCRVAVAQLVVSRQNTMWIATPAFLGCLVTGIMFVLCMAVGSAPMAAGHFDYSIMYVVIVVGALLSAFLARRRAWPLVLFGAIVFCVPVVWFSHSRYHDFSAADPNRWAGEARQWFEIMVVAPLCALVCAGVFVILPDQPKVGTHEQKSD